MKLTDGSVKFPFIVQVHAFSVCDDPDYFYDFVQGLLDGLHAGVNSRDIVNIHNVSFMTSLFMCCLFRIGDFSWLLRKYH